MLSPVSHQPEKPWPEIEESIRNGGGFVPLDRAAKLVAERFHDHGDALAAADAGGRQAVTQVVAAQLIQEGDDQKRAGRRQRMPQSDGPAVDVGLVAVEPQRPFDGEPSSNAEMSLKAPL